MTAGSSGRAGHAGSGGAGIWPPIIPSKLTVSSAWPCSSTIRQSLAAAARPARTVSRYFGLVKKTRAAESRSSVSTCDGLYAVSSGTATAPRLRMPR